MRWALYSDIHGNLEALEAVLPGIKAAGADRIVCMGDVVGYGASPNECVAAVRANGAEVIAGNHDYAALGRVNIDEFNDHARDAILWTREALSEEGTAWLASLGLVINGPDTLIVHASPGDPEEWNYILGPGDATREFRNFTEKIGFVGHSHSPGLFLQDDSGALEWELPANEPMDIPAGRRALVNVGSVGQPRDRDPRAAWLLYDSDAAQVTLHRVPYDIESAQRRILDAGLPPFLAFRLAMGV